MPGGKSGHSRHTSCLWSSIDISLSAAAVRLFECEFGGKEGSLRGKEGSASIRHVDHKRGREEGRDLLIDGWMDGWIEIQCGREAARVAHLRRRP